MKRLLFYIFKYKIYKNNWNKLVTKANINSKYFPRPEGGGYQCKI